MDVLTPVPPVGTYSDECECDEPILKKMTSAKLAEIVAKACTRAGKEAKQATAGYKKRLAEVEREIADVRKEILQVLEARLAQLKQL